MTGLPRNARIWRQLRYPRPPLGHLSGAAQATITRAAWAPPARCTGHAGMSQIGTTSRAERHQAGALWKRVLLSISPSAFPPQQGACTQIRSLFGARPADHHETMHSICMAWSAYLQVRCSRHTFWRSRLRRQARRSTGRCMLVADRVLKACGLSHSSLGAPKGPVAPPPSRRLIGGGCCRAYLQLQIQRAGRTGCAVGICWCSDTVQSTWQVQLVA